MASELERLGRTGWAREEFALLEGTRWTDDEPGSSYLRLKGARDLSRRELAVLRELVPWRDAVAGTLDRATFRVLGNEQLLDIARTQPQSRDALGKIKGMPRAILEQRGAELLDAVRRALAVPDAELPKFPRAARWDRDSEFDARVSALKTARDAAAKRLELDSGRPLLTRSSWRPSRAGTRRPSTSSRRSRSSGGGRWPSSAPTSCARWSLIARRKRTEVPST